MPKVGEQGQCAVCGFPIVYSAHWRHVHVKQNSAPHVPEPKEEKQ